MFYYSSIADYLENNSQWFNSDLIITLKSKNRPFLKLADNEDLKHQYHFLMERDKGLYEIGFPLIQVADFEMNNSLTQLINIETKQGEIFKFYLEDEVLDETQLINDEDLAKELTKELGKKCDRTTAETISFFIGLFDSLSNHHKNKKISPLNIEQSLEKLSQEDARLPLILALNKRYELRHKLELIAPKLRSQLNRVAEMMPLGHIQEMDAYCLRDYVRRPGKDAIEKAGARQELMGIKRYQNYNTPENRFLKGFCDLLHLECQDYRSNYQEAKSLCIAIERFRQEPSVKTIPRTTIFTGKPNYVLQQNPIYRSFYQAYQDYLKRRTEKEKFWGFRQALLVDIVKILWLEALLKLEGSYLDCQTKIEILDIPKEGKYLRDNQKFKILCLLNKSAFIFNLQQDTNNLEKGDFQLNVTLQRITKKEPEIFNSQWLIWVFWYQPEAEILNKIKETSKDKLPICFYLYPSPELSEKETEEIIESEINLIKIPHPLEENLETGVRLITEKICYWLAK